MIVSSTAWLLCGVANITTNSTHTRNARKGSAAQLLSATEAVLEWLFNFNNGISSDALRKVYFMVAEH